MEEVMSLSLYDLLSNFMTAEELNNLRTIDLSPEFILECCMESPGVQGAKYLVDGNFEVDSTAGVIRFKITDGQNL